MGGGKFKMSASKNEMEVGKILGERKSRRGLEYLVRWKNFGKVDDTWELSANIKHAVKSIKAFHAKATPKRTKKSSSRSRSRSKGRSKSRSRSRSRTSASPGRKKASSTTKRNTTTATMPNMTDTKATTPNMTETKTETVTESPGRTEQVIETQTVTKSVESPVLTQRISSVTRTTETHTSKTPLDQVDSGTQKSRYSVMSWGCGALKSACNSCRGVVCTDYPAVVVFATIALIAMTFVIQDNVNFEELWSSIVAFFAWIWNWLSTLVPTQKE